MGPWVADAEQNQKKQNTKPQRGKWAESPAKEREVKKKGGGTVINEAMEEVMKHCLELQKERVVWRGGTHGGKKSFVPNVFKLTKEAPLCTKARQKRQKHALWLSETNRWGRGKPKKGGGCDRGHRAQTWVARGIFTSRKVNENTGKNGRRLFLLKKNENAGATGK